MSPFIHLAVLPSSCKTKLLHVVHALVLTCINNNICYKCYTWMCAVLCDSYLIVKDSLLTQIMPTPPWDPIIFHLISSCTANCAKALGYSSASFVLKPPDFADPLSWTCFWPVNLQTRSPFMNLRLHFIAWTSDGSGRACQSQQRVGFCHFVPKQQKSQTSCCQHGILVKHIKSGTDHIMLRSGFSNPQGTDILKHILMMIKDCCKVRFPFERVLRSPSWQGETPSLTNH